MEGSENKDRTPGHDNSLQMYIDHIRRIPLLTFEEELDLSRKIQNGSEAARHRLIEANLRLVVKIARSYLAPDISLMDLIQEGNLGLMRAAGKYDHQKQVRFSTYAAWWIRQAISRYLSDKRRTIRLPHRKEEMLRRIQQTFHTLSQLHMRKPRLEEIAKEIGVPAGEVEFVLSLSHNIVSLESVSDTNDSTGVIEFLEDLTYSPEQVLLKKSSREATLKILDLLKDREKNILIHRYQLNGGKRQTLRSISDKMGLSTETVRQIEFRALKKLRRHAEELRSYVEAI